MSTVREHLKEIITEPESPGVAEGSAEVEGVAEAVEADVAKTESTEGAISPAPDPDPSILPDELTDDERIRAWQSAVSKKQTAADARIAELETALASASAGKPAADDPLPGLEKERAGLLDSWKAVNGKMEEAKGEERDTLLIQQWQLRRKIFDADVARFCYIHGADPADPSFEEAYEGQEVTGPHDVERLALLVAKGGGTSTTRADSLAQREAALKEREGAIASLLKAERAKIRREMGLDDVPGTGVNATGKVSPEAKVVQDYKALQSSGKTGRVPMKELIRLQLENPEAFSK